MEGKPDLQRTPFTKVYYKSLELQFVMTTCTDMVHYLWGL